MPVLSRTEKIPTLIDGSEYKMESDIPDGGTDSAVDLCQALDWIDLICATRPREIPTRVMDEPTPHSKTTCCIVDGYYCFVADRHCFFPARLWYVLHVSHKLISSR